MFKFSYNWLKAESEIETDYEELLHWLDIQGFEIASIEDYGDDKAVEIEVKANRPDMLSPWWTPACAPTSWIISAS